MTKPSISRFITIGAWPVAAHERRAARSTTSGAVQGAGTSSTGRDEVGRVDRVARRGSGARPARCSVKCEGRMAEVELARIASGGRQRGRARANSAALDLEILGRVLLHMAAPSSAAASVGRERDAAAHRRRRLRRRAGPAPRGRRAGRSIVGERRLDGACGPGPRGATSQPARAKAIAQARPMKPAADDRDAVSAHPRHRSLTASRHCRQTPSDWPGDVAAERREQEQDHVRRRPAGSPSAAARRARGSAAPSPRRRRRAARRAPRITPSMRGPSTMPGRMALTRDAVRARAPWRGSGSGR